MIFVDALLDAEDRTHVGRAHVRTMRNQPLVTAATLTTCGAPRQATEGRPKSPEYTGFAGLLGAVLDHTKPRSGMAVGSHPRCSSSRTVLGTTSSMVSACIACFNASLISVWYQPDQPALRLT